MEVGANEERLQMGTGLLFGGDENVLELEMRVVQACKKHWIVHFKMVDFVAWESYLSKIIKKNSMDKLIYRNRELIDRK